MIETIFWTCAASAIYTYAVYPVLLFLIYSVVQAWRDLKFLAWRSDRRRRGEAYLPYVSVIVPVYNEVQRLPAKLQNLKMLSYPRHRLEILFISDHSTDGTNELLRGGPWRTIELPERKGKANALNCALEQARGEILVLCDASTLMPANAIEKMVRHFADPQVGLVSTSVYFRGNTESRQTEGVYWKYESMLRLMEARLGATLVASGPLYALRRSCFRRLPVNTLVDDLVTALWARQAGLRLVHDGEVVGVDYAAATVAQESSRRIRLAVGTLRAVPEMMRTRFGAIGLLAFVSHKVLRWVLPVFMAGLLASNCMLEGAFYRFVLALQAGFYLWAAVGYRWRERLQHIRLLLLPYFLVSMHTAFVVGAMQWAKGEWRGGTWERVT